MKKLYSRHFDVDFFEKDYNSWIVRSHLIDETHDISTEVEVSVPDMTIIDAKIQFEKFPLNVCPLIEKNVKRLIGLNLFKNYQWKSLLIFLGSKGCGNVLSILGIGLQALIYNYYPHQIKTGKMSYEEWDKFMVKKLRRACLGHTLFEKNMAKWSETIRK